MNVTAEHAGGAVVLELDEGCRSVAALRRIVSAALPDVREDGFDVTVQGRAVEDVDVCGLEEGATIQVVQCRRVVALDALRAAGRDVSEDGLEDGMFEAVYDGDVALCEQYLDACGSPFLRECSGALLRYAGLAVCELLLSRGAVELLLQHGADVNATYNCGETALHRTARTGQPAICQLLATRRRRQQAERSRGNTVAWGAGELLCQKIPRGA